MKQHSISSDERTLAELTELHEAYASDARALFTEADYASKNGLHATASELHTLGLIAHVRACKLQILIDLYGANVPVLPSTLH